MQGILRRVAVLWLCPRDHTHFRPQPPLLVNIMYSTFTWDGHLCQRCSNTHGNARDASVRFSSRNRQKLAWEMKSEDLFKLMRREMIKNKLRFKTSCESMNRFIRTSCSNEPIRRYDSHFVMAENVSFGCLLKSKPKNTVFNTFLFTLYSCVSSAFWLNN